MRPAKTLEDFVREHPVKVVDPQRGISHKVEVFSQGVEGRPVFTAQIEKHTFNKTKENPEGKTLEGLTLILHDYPMPPKKGRSALDVTVSLTIYQSSGERWMEIHIEPLGQNEAAKQRYIDRNPPYPVADITPDEMELYAGMLHILHAALLPEIEATRVRLEQLGKEEATEE